MSAQGRWKRIVFSFLVGSVSAVVSLGVAEVVVRLVLPQKLSVNVTQWDADVGFINIPGAEGYGERTDYRMRIVINSRSLRDREFAYTKPTKTVRIGVFGDSFTFGEGVQNDETFSKRLEEFLRSYAQRAGIGVEVEVLNFGIGKTGTSHQLGWYRKEGRKYGLDVVVVAFFAGNDIEDNWAGVYSLQGDNLVHNATSYSSVRRIQTIVLNIPAYRWSAQHSHLVNVLRVAATLYDDWRRTQRAGGLNMAAVGRTPEDLEARKYAMTLKLVETFRADAERDGAHFVLVTIPQQGQKRLAEYTAGSPAPPFVPYLDRLLVDLAAEAVDVLDVVPTFEDSPRPDDYYFAHDGHFNAAGHLAFARLLAAHLQPDLVRLAGARSAVDRSGTVAPDHR